MPAVDDSSTNESTEDEEYCLMQKIYQIDSIIYQMKVAYMESLFAPNMLKTRH
ncbi:unnamed protein product [Rhodiola kirilowii]